MYSTSKVLLLYVSMVIFLLASETMPACLAAAGSGDPSSSPVKQPVRGLDATGTTEPVEDDCSKAVDISQTDEGSSARPPTPFQRYNHTFSVSITIVSMIDPPRDLYNLRLSCEHFFDVAYGPIPSDPFIFRSVSPSECLLNNGAVMKTGDALAFEYQRESKYPFKVSTVSC